MGETIPTASPCITLGFTSAVPVFLDFSRASYLNKARGSLPSTRAPVYPVFNSCKLSLTPGNKRSLYSSSRLFRTLICSSYQRVCTRPDKKSGCLIIFRSKSTFVEIPSILNSESARIIRLATAAGLLSIACPITLTSNASNELLVL